MTVEERDAYYARTRVVDEESVTETWTFWAFVAGGVLGLVLLILLICCLIRMKQKNSEIVAKVEKLSTD